MCRGLCRGDLVPAAQYCTCDLVGAKGGASLESQTIGVPIQLTKLLKRKPTWNIDGFGDGAIHPGLQRRLHAQMCGWRQGMGTGAPDIAFACLMTHFPNERAHTGGRLCAPVVARILKRWEERTLEGTR